MMHNGMYNTNKCSTVMHSQTKLAQGTKCEGTLINGYLVPENAVEKPN